LVAQIPDHLDPSCELKFTRVNTRPSLHNAASLTEFHTLQIDTCERPEVRRKMGAFATLETVAVHNLQVVGAYTFCVSTCQGLFMYFAPGQGICAVRNTILTPNLCLINCMFISCNICGDLSIGHVSAFKKIERSNYIGMKDSVTLDVKPNIYVDI